ncbi:MAG: citramalate synthase [Chitinivibrionales bacterium]
MKHKKSILIYDTTLRDGNQAFGISLSLSDKLRIAERLSDLGFHYIEGGWPNPTNTTDIEFYKEANKRGFAAKIAAFGSTRRPNVSCYRDDFLQILVKTGAPVATIFGKSWDLHVKHVIKTSEQENLDMIAESVSYLKRHMDEVVYDAEHFFDGYLYNKDYALKTLFAAQQAGADCIVLCDTNGGMLPDRFTRIFKDVKTHLQSPLGVHIHNDSGCAEANSIIGILEGATQVQGTVNGYGERCGNANLCTIIPALQLKRGYQLLPARQLEALTSVSVFISEIANVAHNPQQPYVGEAAFSHKAGMHADAVLKINKSYEHVNPGEVGNARRFVVSIQAGSSTIRERLPGLKKKIDKHDPIVKKLLAKIKALETQGYQFEAAEGSFELLAKEMLGLFREDFEFKGFRVIEEKRENGEVFSEATIKVKADGVLEHTAAEGDGPVNALDNALRKALARFYPSLLSVKLEDFKVRVLEGKEGTAAKVRVLIESSDGNERWGTVGVSTNVIEASWLALIDSLKYKLMKDEEHKEKKPNK